MVKQFDHHPAHRKCAQGGIDQPTALQVDGRRDRADMPGEACWRCAGGFACCQRSAKAQRRVCDLKRAAPHGLFAIQQQKFSSAHRARWAVDGQHIAFGLELGVLSGF